MTGRFKGRTALITGASRGIGAVIAKTFAQQGARCMLAARNTAGLDRVVADIKAAGGQASAFALDLEDPTAIAAVLETIKSTTPVLDIFVANAALGGVRVPLIQYPPEIWRQLFQVNVHANLQLLSGLHPLLVKSDAGRVVMITTGVSRFPRANTGAYACSKAAFEAMTGIYALEVAGTPIKINMVNPGATRTEMRAEAYPKEDPMTLKVPEAVMPLLIELASGDCTRHGEWIAADTWLAGDHRGVGLAVRS